MEIRTAQKPVRLPRKLREPLGPVLAHMLAALLCAVPAYLLSQYAAAHPDWAEAYILAYSNLSEATSTLIGILPFSFAEFWLVIVAFWTIAPFVYRLIHGRPLRALAGLLTIAAVLYAIFAAGWGVAYSRRPYADAAGLDVRPRSVAALESLCLDLASSANALRENLPEDERGVFLSPKTNHELLASVQSAYDAAALAYPWLSGSYGNPKPVLLSVPMSYLQISGIYFPFTFEANVNMNNNSFMIPATAAHEAAHLRGWAREDEANFIAYLVCRESGDETYMYSGTLLALIHAGNALYSADTEAYRHLTDTYAPGLVRDLAAHGDHWRKYEGKAAEIHEQINDAYLRVNRQPDGVQSYGRMVDLLLAERERGT